MAESTHVRVDRNDGVVVVSLNRPETKNGIRPQDWEALCRIFGEIDKNPHDRVVVVTGSEGTFSSGAELGARSEELSPLTPMRVVNDACLAVRDIRQPTIAKISGFAVGAGFNLALACDLAVADESAKFSQIFTRRGMSVDFGGTWHLAQAMSLQRAKELAFFGDFLTSAEVYELGLLNRVVAATDLDDVVAEWTNRLRALPPIALARTKRLLNSALDDGFASTLHNEAVAQEFNATTNDTREAIAAFLEKRTPQFHGN